MSAADINTMLEKLAKIVDTTYLSEDENQFVKTALSSAILTTGQISALETIYTRVFSLKV